ncbi:unnamed protein product [Owenia fusiformis]|uniref:Uncharacterized protein n=1 Tax=Owenia fusiformis TaxID=6347 RepID=A0A8J1UT24_OWEFU|nr:unnamed protein product [Owenia fusiformis]
MPDKTKNGNGHLVKDGGWGWIIVGSSFIIQALTVGITYTFGVLYVDLLDYFKEPRSVTSWIGSIQPFLMYFTGIVVGPLMKRFGCRAVTFAGSVLSTIGFLTSALVNNIYILYFTYGVLSGIGNGMMYVSSMLVVQYYFEEKRALATGIAVAGSGLGTLVFGLLTRYLLDMVKWRWTLVIEAGFLLLGTLCSLVMLPVPSNEEADDTAYTAISDDHETVALTASQKETKGENGDIKTKYYDPDLERQSSQSNGVNVVVMDKQGCCSGWCESTKSMLKDIFDFSMFKNPILLIFSIAMMLISLGYHAPFTYTPDRAISLGIDPERASFLVSIIGIANVSGRIIFGWIGNASEKSRHILAGVSILICGASTICSPIFTTYPLMAVYAAIFGATTGCYFSLFVVILVDLLGVDVVDKSLGLVMGVSSIAFLIASPFSGWLIDLTGTFDTPFYVVGGVMVLGGLMFLSTMCIKKAMMKRQLEEQRSLLRAKRRLRKRTASWSM